MAYPEKCNLSSLARSLSDVSGARCAKMNGKDAVYGRFRNSDLKEAAFGRCRLWGLKGPDGEASIGKATIWGTPDNSEAGFRINVLFWGSRNCPEKGSVRVSERNETKSLRACRSKGIIRGLGLLVH